MRWKEVGVVREGKQVGRKGLYAWKVRQGRNAREEERNIKKTDIHKEKKEGKGRRMENEEK